MSDEAVAAPVNPAPQQSIHEQIKQHLAPQEPAKAEAPKVAPVMEAPEGVETEAVPEASAEDQPEAVSEDESEGDAPEAELQLSSIDDLAEATGLELDKILDLAIKTKIDGKEGTAKVRDLLKSYQLDGHINNKLESINTERKSLAEQRQKFESERADKLLQMDAGLKTLERALVGEFQSIDWQKLSTESPETFNAKYVQFQQRNAELQDIAKQIAAEQAAAQAQQREAYESWLNEQRELMKAKIPEWSDDTRRSKDKADIQAYLSDYGISKEEFEQIADHRYALVIRDALQWYKLQKSKPATLNKVKLAPKLLKPGSQQSKTASSRLSLNKSFDKLRASGKVRDAKDVLKQQLFG